MIVARSY